MQVPMLINMTLRETETVIPQRSLRETINLKITSKHAVFVFSWFRM